MKFGKTQEEKIATEKAKAGKWRKFALLPKWCWNTDRWVWLEFYDRAGEYNVNHQTTFFYNFEITE